MEVNENLVIDLNTMTPIGEYLDEDADQYMVLTHRIEQWKGTLEVEAQQALGCCEYARNHVEIFGD